MEIDDKQGNSTIRGKSNRQLQPYPSIKTTMKLLPLLAALLASPIPTAAVLPSGGRAFRPLTTANGWRSSSHNNKQRQITRTSKVLEMARGGAGPLPVEDTAKLASAFCEFGHGSDPLLWLERFRVGMIEI